MPGDEGVGAGADGVRLCRQGEDALADLINQPLGADRPILVHRRGIGDQIAVNDDMLPPVAPLRRRLVKGAGVQHVGQHHRVAGDAPPSEIVR